MSTIAEGFKTLERVVASFLWRGQGPKPASGFFECSRCSALVLDRTDGVHAQRSHAKWHAEQDELAARVAALEAHEENR